MKKSQGYKFHYAENTIVVNKSFLKKASTIGSAEYNELARVRRDYPDFMIIEREIDKKPGKKAYGKLNYKKMEEFIETQEEENAPAVLAEFEHVKQFSKSKNNPYYGNRWSIECCFKVCKSLLKLGKEFHGVSYDLTVSSTALVFTRYILLEWIRRQENDGRTLGELVYCVFDEVRDMELADSLRMLYNVPVKLDQR